MEASLDPSSSVIRPITAPLIENLQKLRAGRQVSVLEGLRGLAIVMVIIYHTDRLTSGSTGAAWAFSHLVRECWSGVDLFFVLSGFLITGILVDAKGSKGFFTVFYARRTLRIFPLYYAALVVLLFVLPSVSSRWEYVPVLKQLWLWFYAVNFAVAINGGWDTLPRDFDPCWSLGVEEQFYLLWPAVIYYLSGVRLKHACYIAIGLGVLTRTVCVLTNNDAAAYTLMPARIDEFGVGAWLALMLRESNLSADRTKRFAWGVFGASAVAIALISMNVRRFRFDSPIVSTIGITILACLFGAMIVLALASDDRGWIGRLFRSSFLSHFGRYSYAIYIIHFPVIEFLAERSNVLYKLKQRFGDDSILLQLTFAVVVFASSFLFGLISWHAFEKHFLRFKDRFRYERAPAAPDLPAAAA